MIRRASDKIMSRKSDAWVPYCNIRQPDGQKGCGWSGGVMSQADAMERERKHNAMCSRRAVGLGGRGLGKPEVTDPRSPS